MKITILNSVLFVLVIISSGCVDKKLKNLDEFVRLYQVNANINVCSIEPEMSKSFLKFIFVIDKSTSNQTSSPDGTDPFGNRRYRSILNFLDFSDSASDDMTEYGYINFSTDAHPYDYIDQDANRDDDGDGNGVDQFFADKDAFRTRIETERTCADSNVVAIGTCPFNKALLPSSNDSGWTNYADALTKVKERITSDINTSKNKMIDETITTHYVVIFISDGFPETALTQNETEAEKTSRIQNYLLQVGEIKALAEDIRYKEYAESITFHTGYYYGSYLGGGSIDIEAQNIMSDMANTGGGQGYQFGSGRLLDFNQFAIPQRYVKHSIKDIFVINTNVRWDTDKSVVSLDADADGIIDRLETILGSDPNDPDTDKNGIRDGIEYHINGSPCASSTCDPTVAHPYRSCNAFIRPGWIQGQSNKFMDQDNDRLNDCEEHAVLDSKYDNFDSNEDWVPDELAYSFGGISYIQNIGDSGKLLDSDFDGMNNYTELKMNTPWNINNNYILDLEFSTYVLKMTTDTSKKTCFNLNVDKIPFVSTRSDGGHGQNLIRVYVVEKTGIIDDRRYLRIAEKWTNSGETINFNPEDFK